MYASRMPRKPIPKPDDPEQSKRFIDMAREVGAEEGPEGRKTFERAFKGVVRGSAQEKKSQPHGQSGVSGRAKSR